MFSMNFICKSIITLNGIFSGYMYLSRHVYFLKSINLHLLTYAYKFLYVIVLLNDFKKDTIF